MIPTDTQDIKIEEVLKSYSGSSNSYSVVLDGVSLTGFSLFGDLNLTITTKGSGESALLNKVTLKTKVAAVVSIEASLTVNSNKIDWTFFPSQSTLNGYSAYNI